MPRYDLVIVECNGVAHNFIPRYNSLILAAHCAHNFVKK